MKNLNLFAPPAGGKLYGWAVIGCLVVLTSQTPAFAAQLSTLVYFGRYEDRRAPDAGLVLDAAGNLYGTTQYGTEARPESTIFRLAPPAAGQTAWTRTTLATFNAATDGRLETGLVLDSAGNLYGDVAVFGGDDTVFRLMPPTAGQTAWTRTTLATFNAATDGSLETRLMLDAAGNLYGIMAGRGKHGLGHPAVFRLAPPTAGRTEWTRTTLATFSDTSGMIFNRFALDAAGNLYGTIKPPERLTNGGAHGDGSVFKLAPPTAGQAEWTRTTLATFNGKNGASPGGGLVLDTAGNLYGTTSFGGAYDDGTVFRLSPPATGQTQWTLTTLATFNGKEGRYPDTGLVRDAAGNLYGTAFMGAANHKGSVFRLSPPTAGQTQWTLTTLATFDGTNGAYPDTGLLLDSAGNLYGTTVGAGVHGSSTVFKVTP